MVKISLRQKIISGLIKSRELSVADLIEKTSSSRVSVSKELQALKSSEIVTKKQGSTSYTLSSETAFVIFKLYHDSAELLTYSLDGSVHEREKIELLHSLPYEDNVIFLAQRIEKRGEFLKKKFKKIFTCMIHDKRLNSSHPIYKTFEFMDRRAELVARHIQYTQNNEAVLYINNRASISFICKDGAVVTPNAYPNDKILQSAKMALGLIKPNRIVLEGKELESLSSLCFKNDIPLCFINADKGLYTDECEMIEEALYKASQN